MSITFWCPDAPTEKYKPYPEEEPDFETTRSLLPELNLSNSNALAMLDLMGLRSANPQDDYCGTVPVPQLPAVIERLRRVVSDPLERAATLEPASVNGVPQGATDLATLLRKKLGQSSPRQPGQGPTMYDFGRNDDYVRTRAQVLLQVFESAQSNGYAVSWG